MKKFWTLASLVFLAGLLPLSPVSGSELYVLSGNPYAPPVVWEEHQKLVGLAPDIAQDILTKLNIPYDLRRFGNWQNVQTKTRENQIDMILSAYINNERKQYMEFSEPYLSQPVVIVVEKGKEFDFTTWDALIGKKGVSSIGESYGQEFDDFIADKLDVKYFEFERAIQLMNLGEADYLIVDLYTALIYARLLQGEDAISILEPYVTVQDFHFGIRKNSKLLGYLPQINEELQKKVNNREVMNLFFAYFDKWKKLIDRRASFFLSNQQMRSEQHQIYIKEQDEIARQAIIRTMTDRDGLPLSAH